MERPGTDTIRVVVVSKETGLAYKTRVPLSTYQTSKDGKTHFEFPQNVMSMGFYERVWGGEWGELPALPPNGSK